jgi:hypothetical protein
MLPCMEYVRRPVGDRSQPNSEPTVHHNISAPSSRSRYLPLDDDSIGSNNARKLSKLLLLGCKCIDRGYAYFILH